MLPAVATGRMPIIRSSLIYLLVHLAAAHPPAWERITPIPTSIQGGSAPLSTAQQNVERTAAPTPLAVLGQPMLHTATEHAHNVNDHTSSIIPLGTVRSPIEAQTNGDISSMLKPSQIPGNYWHNTFGNSTDQIVGRHSHHNVTGFVETNRQHASKLQRPKGPIERGISPSINEPCAAMEKFDGWIQNMGNGRVNVPGEQPISFDFSYRIELWPCAVGNFTVKTTGKPTVVEGRYKASDQLESEKGPIVARQSSLDIATLNCPQKYKLYDNSITCRKIPAVPNTTSFCKMNFTAHQDPLEPSTPTIRLIFGSCAQDQAATSLWVKAVHGTPPIWTFAGLTAETQGPHAAALSIARKQLPVTKDFEPGVYDLEALQSQRMIPSLQPRAIEARRQGVHNAALASVLACFEPEENYKSGSMHYWANDNPGRNSPAGYAAWKNDKDWATRLRQLEEDTSSVVS